MNTALNILIAQAEPRQSPILAFLPLLLLIAIAFIILRRRAKGFLAKAQGARSDAPRVIPDIHFDCPKCSQAIDAPREMATQLIDCPSCKEVIEVPVRSLRVEPAAPALSKLIKCPSCQSDVSTEAAACPKCGHQFVYAGGFKHAGGINLRDPVHRIGLGVCVIFIIGVLYYIHSVAFNNSAAAAQETQRIKDIDDSTRGMRKAVDDLDAALHPK